MYGYRRCPLDRRCRHAPGRRRRSGRPETVRGRGAGVDARWPPLVHLSFAHCSQGHAATFVRLKCLTVPGPKDGCMEISVVIVVVIVTALAFDYTNGFHDTANAVATSIATGALKPRTAVLMAGVLNLVGAFLSVQVAKTISSGLVDETMITPRTIFAGVVGAIVWNLLTWLIGLPSSSSHALIGGLIGARVGAGGADGVKFGSLIGKVLLPA